MGGKSSEGPDAEGCQLKKVVIFADDLTGAFDSGIKFKNAGLDTKVLTQPLNFESFQHIQEPVVSINTDTRRLCSEEAENRTHSIVQKIAEFGDHLYYKKADSVLRGNISQELKAMSRILDPDFVLIAPAFPDNGRRLRDGVLYIEEYGTTTELLNAREKLAASSGCTVAIIDLKIVRKGWEAVVQQAEALRQEGACLLLADAWENDDLRCLARAVSSLGKRCLPVGSAGLAQYLAETLQLNYLSATSAPFPGKTPSGSSIVVIGSRHPNTVSQLQQLKKHEHLQTWLINVRGITRENMYGRLNERRCAVMNPGTQGYLITTDTIYNALGCNPHLLKENEYNALVLEALSIMTAELYRQCKPKSLIVTGGDMAGDILKKIELNEIDLQSEFKPGVVIGEAVHKSGDRLLFAAKSGGFGEEDLLLKLYRHLSPESVALQE